MRLPYFHFTVYSVFRIEYSHFTTIPYNSMIVLTGMLEFRIQHSALTVMPNFTNHNGLVNRISIKNCSLDYIPRYMLEYYYYYYYYTFIKICSDYITSIKNIPNHNSNYYCHSYVSQYPIISIKF